MRHWDEQWIAKHRDSAFLGLKDLNKSGFMEVRMTIPDSKLNVAQGELLRQAEAAQIHTFGWPIGIVLDREGARPKPTTDDIVAEIVIKDIEKRESYDYWAIRKDGAFYLLKSLFEDQRRPGHIFFNTRIVRITETLLYAARLYAGLKVPPDYRYLVGIRHGGLKDRVLSTSSIARRFPPHGKISSVEEVYNEVETTIEKTESNPVDLVQSFTEPLFVVFNFFELNRAVLEEIVNKYVAGEVT